jgi:hypothetical protein
MSIGFNYAIDLGEKCFHNHNEKKNKGKNQGLYQLSTIGKQQDKT